MRIISSPGLNWFDSALLAFSMIPTMPIMGGVNSFSRSRCRGDIAARYGVSSALHAAAIPKQACSSSGEDFLLLGCRIRQLVTARGLPPLHTMFCAASPYRALPTYGSRMCGAQSVVKVRPVVPEWAPLALSPPGIPLWSYWL